MKNRHLFKLMICWSLMISGCKGQTSNEVTATEISKFITEHPDAQIVDVRTGEEFSNGHIKNARNIDWYEPSFEEEVSKLDKTKPVVVYCLSGKRSAAAAGKMRSIGFPEVMELKGGMMQWRAEKLPEEGAEGAADAGMTKQQFDMLLNNDRLLLVDFYADWCQPCQKMKPYLEEIANDMKEKVVVLRINADENRKLCSELGVAALPVLQLYRGHKIVWSHDGFISKEEVIEQLNKH